MSTPSPLPTTSTVTSTPATGTFSVDSVTVTWLRIANSAEHCFALRQIDETVMRLPRTQSDRDSDLSYDAKAEETVSLRHACSCLSIPLYPATHEEIVELKRANAIGCRAPCASLILGSDLVRVLTTFGRRTYATIIRSALSLVGDTTIEEGHSGGLVGRVPSDNLKKNKKDDDAPPRPPKTTKRTAAVAAAAAAAATSTTTPNSATSPSSGTASRRSNVTPYPASATKAKSPPTGTIGDDDLVGYSEIKRTRASTRQANAGTTTTTTNGGGLQDFSSANSTGKNRTIGGPGIGPNRDGNQFVQLGHNGFPPHPQQASFHNNNNNQQGPQIFQNSTQNGPHGHGGNQFGGNNNPNNPLHSLLASSQQQQQQQAQHSQSQNSIAGQIMNPNIPNQNSNPTFNHHLHNHSSNPSIPNSSSTTLLSTSPSGYFPSTQSPPKGGHSIVAGNASFATNYHQNNGQNGGTSGQNNTGGLSNVLGQNGVNATILGRTGSTGTGLLIHNGGLFASGQINNLYDTSTYVVNRGTLATTSLRLAIEPTNHQNNGHNNQNNGQNGGNNGQNVDNNGNNTDFFKNHHRSPLPSQIPQSSSVSTMNLLATPQHKINPSNSGQQMNNNNNNNNNTNLVTLLHGTNNTNNPNGNNLTPHSTHQQHHQHHSHPSQSILGNVNAALLGNTNGIQFPTILGGNGLGNGNNNNNNTNNGQFPSNNNSIILSPPKNLSRPFPQLQQTHSSYHPANNTNNTNVDLPSSQGTTTNNLNNNVQNGQQQNNIQNNLTISGIAGAPVLNRQNTGLFSTTTPSTALDTRQLLLQHVNSHGVPSTSSTNPNNTTPPPPYITSTYQQKRPQSGLNVHNPSSSGTAPPPSTISNTSKLGQSSHQPQNRIAGNPQSLISLPTNPTPNQSNQTIISTTASSSSVSPPGSNPSALHTLTQQNTALNGQSNAGVIPASSYLMNLQLSRINSGNQAILSRINSGMTLPPGQIRNTTNNGQPLAIAGSAVGANLIISSLQNVAATRPFLTGSLSTFHTNNTQANPLALMQNSVKLPGNPVNSGSGTDNSPTTNGSGDSANHNRLTQTPQPPTTLSITPSAFPTQGMFK